VRSFRINSTGLKALRPAAVDVDCWDRAHALISVVALFSYRQTLVDHRKLAQVQRFKRHQFKGYRTPQNLQMVKRTKVLNDHGEFQTVWWVSTIL
jgi:hypothetical protein